MDSGRRLFLLGVFLAFPAFAADGVDLKGLVRHPSTLRVDDLRELKLWTFEDARGVPRSERKDRPSRRYRGVRLRDVLDRAGLIERAPRDLRKTLVVVEARDGYRALFSWPELYLSPNGEGVYLVIERDGKPLGGDEGPVALVSLRDTSPGPRHVKQVASIDIRLIGD